MAKPDKSEKEDRGRSAEAQDPNRPIDPVTGEKVGLGPRWDKPEKPVEEPEPEAEPTVEPELEP